MTLSDHRKAIDRCTYCPKLCRWACPVAEAESRETVTPWALMTRADDVLTGRAPLDAATAEVWSHCTGCGRCQTACKHGNDVRSVLLTARADARIAGVAPPALLAWAAEEPAVCAVLQALPVGGATRVLGGYGEPAVVEAGLALLRAAGFTDLGRPGVMTHAGARFLEAGDPGAADGALTALRGALHGATQVVCLEAQDAQVLRQVTGVPPILHLIEAIASLADRLRPVLAGDVLYLDACRLGRGLGLYAEPRALLAAAITGRVQEATLHGSEAGCCGAGAGYAAVDPAHAAAVAREAASDLPDLPVVIAAGPCAAHLRAALAPRPVHHLAEVLAAALGGTP